MNTVGYQVRAQLLFIMVLALAIMVSPRIPLPLYLPSRLFEVRLEDILIVVGGIALIRQLVIDKIYVSRAFWPVFVSLAYGMLFTLGAQALHPDGMLRALFYVLKEIEYFIIFLLAANWIKSAKELKAVIYTILLAGLGNEVWGAITLAMGENVLLSKKLHEWLLGAESNRFAYYGMTTFGEVSAFGVCMFYSLLAWVALSAALHSERHRKAYLTLYLAFLLAALLTGEKIALVLFVVGLAVFAALTGVRVVRYVFAMLLALPLLYLIFDWVAQDYPALQRVLHFHSYAIQEDRLSRWRAVWDFFLENPFQGIGKGGLFYLISEAGYLEEFHNHYVKVLAETGLVGLVLFVYMLAYMVRVLWEEYRKANEGVLRTINGAALVAIMGFSVAGLVQDAFKTVLPNGLLWLMLGLAAASWRFGKYKGATCG